MYHQTTIITDDQRLEYTAQAESQERIILNYLILNPWVSFTCETLEKMRLLHEGTPHSSYIRAIANLRRDKKIKKIGQVIGQYSRPISLYMIEV